MAVKRIESLNSSNEIFDNLPLGIILFDEEFNIVDCNENVFNLGILSYSEKDEIIGIKFEPDLFEFFEDAQSFSEENLPLELTLKTLQTKQGIYNITLKVVPFFDEDKFTGGLAVFEDHLFKLAKQNKNETTKFVSLLENFHEGVFIISSQGEIITSKINFKNSEIIKSNAKKIASIFQDEELNKNLVDLFSKLPEEQLIKGNLTGGSHLFRVVLFSKNDDSKIIIVTIDELLEISGKYTAEEIKELEKFQFVSESIIDSVFGVDNEGKINFWSEGAEKIFEYKRSEVFGKFIGKILPGFDSEYFNSLKEVLDKKGLWESELRIQVNKKEKFVNVKLAQIEIDNEKSILGIASDETMRARIERELRFSEERYRNIVTSSKEFILLVGLERKINYVNPSLISLSGYTEEEILNSNFEIFINPEFLKENPKAVDKLFGSSGASLEFPFTNKSGETIYVLASVTPFRNLNGEVQYYSVIMTDISEKKEAEKDMLLIRSVFEASMDGISVLENRKIALANDSFAQKFGFSSIKEVLGVDPLELCDEDDIKLVADSIQRIERGEEESAKIEFKGKRIEDVQPIFSASLTSYSSGKERFIVFIVRDITQSKLSEQLLKESEERYRNITNAINDFLWMAERKNGKLEAVFYSASVERMLGYSSDELKEKRFLWFKMIHPKDRVNTVRQFKQIYSDTSVLNGEVEYRIVNKLGNILWVRNKININRDEEGNINSIVGLVSDITLSKRAEEELKRSAEELANINESKDRFISIISHDLRTPFSSILGYTDVLLNNRDLPEDKQVEYISFIQESAKNMLDLVNSLLDWTRLQTGRIKFEPKKLDASLLANKCVNILGGTALKKNINLVSQVDRQIFIHADEGLMLQALNNLVSNAIKFTNPGGSITINAVPIADEHVVQFSVKDTGLGIRKEDMEKLFRVDSKFTSLGTSGEKGTGLGLSLVKEIVEKHSGKIWVKSKVGKGTEFYFTIPVSSSTILLVDDLLTDRILYAKLIKSILPEYIVKDAPNGKAAFEAVKNINPLLVITEHKMPLMNGDAFIKQIQLADEISLKPSFIVLTRKLTGRIEQTYREIGVKHIFQKPVELDKFRMAMISSINESMTN